MGQQRPWEIPIENIVLQNDGVAALARIMPRCMGWRPPPPPPAPELSVMLPDVKEALELSVAYQRYRNLLAKYAEAVREQAILERDQANLDVQRRTAVLDLGGAELVRALSEIDARLSAIGTDLAIVKDGLTRLWREVEELKAAALADVRRAAQHVFMAHSPGAKTKAELLAELATSIGPILDQLLCVDQLPDAGALQRLAERALLA